MRNPARSRRPESKREHLAALVARDLRDDVRRGSEAVNPESLRVARFAQASISDQTRAEERGGGHIFEVVWNRKTETRVCHGVFRVTAVNRVAGEAGAFTKIFAVRQAESAFAASPAEPWYPNPLADLKAAHLRADLLDPADDFVAENEWQLRLWQFAVEDMEISPADRAGRDTHQ